jgi:hypothetical protein
MRRLQSLIAHFWNFQTNFLVVLGDLHRRKFNPSLLCSSSTHWSVRTSHNESIAHFVSFISFMVSIQLPYLMAGCFRESPSLDNHLNTIRANSFLLLSKGAWPILVQNFFGACEAVK